MNNRIIPATALIVLLSSALACTAPVPSISPTPTFSPSLTNTITPVPSHTLTLKPVFVKETQDQGTRAVKNTQLASANSTGIASAGKTRQAMETIIALTPTTTPTGTPASLVATQIACATIQSFGDPCDNTAKKNYSIARNMEVWSIRVWLSMKK